MKKRIFLSAILMSVFLYSSVFAGQFGMGVISSQYTNGDKPNVMHEVENEPGYGLIATYRFNDEICLGLTSEYFSGTQFSSQEDKGVFRSSLSFFVFPFHMKWIQPFVSAGLAYAAQPEESHYTKYSASPIQFRNSVGFMLPLSHTVGFSADFAIYNDGINYIGWAPSFIMHYQL